MVRGVFLFLTLFLIAAPVAHGNGIDVIYPTNLTGKIGSTLCTVAHSNTFYSKEEMDGLTNASFLDASVLTKEKIESLCDLESEPVDEFENKLISTLWVEKHCKSKYSSHLEFYQMSMKIFEKQKVAAALFIYSPVLSKLGDKIPSHKVHMDVNIPQYSFPWLRCDEFKGSPTGLVHETETGEIFGTRIDSIRVKITVEKGPFEEIFDEWYYFLFLNVIVPLGFIYAICLSLVVLKDKRGGSGGLQNIVAGIGIPIFAIFNLRS